MPSAPRRSPGTSVSPRHRIETLPADWHHFFFTHVGRLRYIPGDQAVVEAVAEADAEGIGGGDSLSFAPGEARARAAASPRYSSVLQTMLQTPLIDLFWADYDPRHPWRPVASPGAGN